jgi:endonuclease YncB( thermonuclease family)
LRRLRRRRARGAQALVVVAILVVIACLRREVSTPPSRPGEPPAAGAPPAAGVEREAVVARVDDGDTITLEDGAQVRYLGIDTPEAGEPLSREARGENRRLVEGRKVSIARGGPEERDGYGRLLALVHAPAAEAGAGRILVNAALVRAGLAWVYITGPEAIDRGPLGLLLEAQREALAGRRGVWGPWLGAGGPREGDLVATRFRIHRRACEEIEGARPRPVSSLEGELRAGKSFCRTCKPQAR